MGNTGEAYYNLGIEAFESGCYEQAVIDLIQAYECGYEREQILESLYACFVSPNQNEFRNHYAENSGEITQLSYEECALDFIPVSEQKFYIFDKVERRFLGAFELEEGEIQADREEFGSVLFADKWDIREMLPVLKAKKWSIVYLLLNEWEPWFASFLKLPGFAGKYLGNAVVLKNTGLMRAFFSECDEFYLPKNLVTPEPEKYQNIIREIHEKRISDMEAERKNVFLSICIPSYNRGTAALKNVRHLLQCPLDSEIEIVISNNGSTEDVEGYQEIQQIKDARISYHEFDENQGYASNVLKTLEMASGIYAMLASDEDMVILGNLGEYLTDIKANVSCGVFRTSGVGANFLRTTENVIQRAGIEAVRDASNFNYITGITYNLKLAKEIGLFDFAAKLRGNLFLEFYTHIVLAMLIGKYADICEMKVVLWNAGKEEEPSQAVLKYMLPESRLTQQNSMMEIYHKGLQYDLTSFIQAFLERATKTWFLLELAYNAKFESYKELYTWEEVCFYAHKENMAYLKEFPYELNDMGREMLERRLLDLFFRYLNSETIIRKYPKDEWQEKRIFHQVIELEMEKYGRVLEELETDTIFTKVTQFLKDMEN